MKSGNPEPKQPTEPKEALGGWADTRDWRLELTLAATPAQRLEWLEEAIRLAYRVGSLPRER